MPNYKKKFVVNNVQEVDLLLMNNEKYSAEIAKTVGAVKRIQILRRAKELGVSVTNQKSAKITKLEDKNKNIKIFNKYEKKIENFQNCFI